ncbi:nucleotidyltransferase family protein [Synechococcus sp. PROS-U-1]|uniref:nucleotidyltransferase family protein n=1 Tax=Synechococcus sp. PROS-U-1 TaxID=1400866 RepID=UPI00164790C6|nr:nucleotidyltransferase family protein [Synechococcus sp. PROS-U-1]QNJ01744.1 mobA-like NTP transferase domain protein [Synechococcus sp. PROS-U-1]
MVKPIRALLLAAGYGTRLRPITYSLPKCLVPIAGKPLLWHWLNKLESLGCESVLINTHYLSSQVEDFLKSCSFRMNILTAYEDNLLGTAGTLLENKTFFEGSTGLLIHSDNVMMLPLNPLLNTHESADPNVLMSMLIFETSNPNNCGIVELDKDNIMIGFHEKIENPPGNLANAAIYVFNYSLLELIESMDPRPKDFSTEVIPILKGRVKTYLYPPNHVYVDIGTVESLKFAQKLWGS